MISGIRRDTAATADDGALFAQNIRFIVEGEYRRRLGMSLAASYSAGSIGRLYSTLTGRFALLVTPAGNLESVAV